MKILLKKQLKKEVVLGKIRIVFYKGGFSFIFTKESLNLILSLFGNNDLFRIKRAANYSSEYFLFEKNNATHAVAYLKYILK